MEEHKKEHDSSCAWDLGEHQEFQKRLEQCEKEKEEYLNGWKRVKADFLNYQKEQRERMEMTIEYVKEKMILDMLPILDNLERAEKQISPADRENQIWKGFSQIALQMREFFKGQGMERRESDSTPIFMKPWERWRAGNPAQLWKKSKKDIKETAGL